MPTIVDARRIDLSDRSDLIRTSLSELWASDLAFHGSAEDIDLTLSVDSLGPLTVTRMGCSGMDMTYKSVADAPNHQASFSMVFHHGPNKSRMRQAGRQTYSAAGDAIIADLTSPYHYAWTGVARASALGVDLNYTSLTTDDVHRALEGPVLETGLGKLAKSHARYVLDNFADLGRTEIERETTARVTSDLMRALITQGVRDENRKRETWHDTEFSRIMAFARQNLRDPDLTPRVIAAAHYISERHLYRLCERAGVRLSDWLMERRLEGARADLSRLALIDTPIEVIAHAWGFRSSAHFSRRFKDAFGQSPRQWRRMNIELSDARRVS